MGRNNKNNRSYKSHRNRQRKNKDREESKQEPYIDNFPQSVVDHGNAKMEVYYALQGLHDHYFNAEEKLVPCETAEEKNKERLLWRKSIGTILPASFRTAFDIPEPLKERLEAELEELVAEAVAAKETTERGEKDNSDPENIFHRIPFLPHAYQLNTDRKFIRKDSTMKKLHLWLRQQTDAGFITRQETVSMVPPVVLAPQPDDIVFDMCAAPGSKTCQILEKLSPNGAMVANDASSQRAYTLVTQLRRIMHNNPVVLVTSCDAQFFPQTISFDRILADVPCSGDGTSRKNIGIWKRWNQLGALALHSLQIDIAFKGVALLKVGGYMCYSTCSHNPIENEAVVAELLRRSKGSLELVDAPLEGFRVRPGLCHWKVLAEEKSNRQMKNEKKKSNAKMRHRMAEWDKKKNEATSDGGDGPADADNGDSAVDENEDAGEGGDDAVDTGEGGNDAVNATDEVAASAATHTGDEEKDKNGPTLRRFEPPSTWDDETFIDLAKAAGLQHFPTLEAVPPNLQKRIKPSCFPPTEEEAQQFKLEKCVRCLAQDNNTGGFFVALLKKVAPISRREARHNKQPAENAEEVDPSDDGPETKRAKPNPESGKTEDPVAKIDNAVATNDENDATQTGGALKGNRLSDRKGGHTDLGRDDFVAPADPKIFDAIIDFYGFTENFPKDQCLTRACGDSKILYYLGRSVKENFIDKGIQSRVTIINSGVKAFVRNSNLDSNTPYRLSQEGVHFLLPYMTKRKVVAELKDFTQCLAGEGKVIPFTEFSEDFTKSVSPFKSGPIVVILKGYETEYTKKMILVMWRCRTDAINCLVNKVEIEGMKSKLATLEDK